MTVNDPRPALAAMLAARLAPAAEALALAYAEDMNAGPPPEDRRACAEHHRAGRAALAHLRQLLALLDWSAKRMPEPETAGAPADAPDEPVAGPPDPQTGYDGSEDEFHYGGEVWKGSIAAPGFGEWLGDLERRVGRIPMKEGEEGRLIECHVGERVFVGPPDTPEFEAWRERQRQREAREKQQAAARPHDTS